jgi:hypothetical protein
MVRRLLRWALIAAVVLLVGAQLVPYGRAHTNPPVRAEPAWDSPRTRELAVAACFDCHSNQTAWPWYTSVAPMSWLTQRDVDEGRNVLNLSEFDRPQEEAGESAETVEEGEMPPRAYTLLHSGARLDDRERAELIAGLRATLGTDD